MSDIAIQVENISKKFELGTIGAGTLRETLANGWDRLRKGRNGLPDEKEFWALKDINFEVKQGEVVGIIGKNGAGKSTLLKVLSRITEPTTGRIKLNGRIASLLEVGTGFHPELTGRENVFLNGSILGMTRQEIKRKFDEIVAFSGVEKFLDTPVKRYSSGMYVRLAFAVAAHLEPEILVIDEVLAVGDAEFQKKCLGKMKDVAGEGRTVLFVSHNMGAVKNLCTKAILLAEGSIILNGETQYIVKSYLKSGTEEGVARYRWKEEQEKLEEKAKAQEVVLSEAQLQGENNQPIQEIFADTAIQILLRYRVVTEVQKLRIAVQLQSREGFIAFTSYEDSAIKEGRTVSPGEYEAICTIPKNFLNIDEYYVLVNIDSPGIKVYHYMSSVLSFQVHESESFYRYNKSPAGVLRPLLHWRTQAIPPPPQLTKSNHKKNDPLHKI